MKKVHTKEYQNELVRRYKKDGDTDARDELLSTNVPFIHRVVRSSFKKIGSVLSYDDVYQECVVGFLIAINTFDANRNVKFITHAYYQMRNHCNQLIYNNLHAVKLPTSQSKRKLIWSAGTLQKKLAKEGKEFNLKNLSEELGATPESLKESFQLLRTLNYKIPVPSESTGDEEESAQNAAFYSMYESSSFKAREYSNPYQSALVKECCVHVEIFKKRLADRDKDVFEKRVLELPGSEPLEVLAQRWGVTKQRIAQVQEDIERAFRLYCLNHVI
jgi:RNA polymerase sigma factor (sigma-70 family)